MIDIPGLQVETPEVGAQENGNVGEMHMEVIDVVEGQDLPVNGAVTKDGDGVGHKLIAGMSVPAEGPKLVVQEDLEKLQVRKAKTSRVPGSGGGIIPSTGKLMTIDVKDRIEEGVVEIVETSMSMKVGAVLMCLRKSCRGLCP